MALSPIKGDYSYASDMAARRADREERTFDPGLGSLSENERKTVEAVINAVQKTIDKKVEQIDQKKEILRKEERKIPALNVLKSLMAKVSSNTISISENDGIYIDAKVDEYSFGKEDGASMVIDNGTFTISQLANQASWLSSATFGAPNVPVVQAIAGPDKNLFVAGMFQMVVIDNSIQSAPVSGYGPADPIAGVSGSGIGVGTFYINSRQVTIDSNDSLNAIAAKITSAMAFEGEALLSAKVVALGSDQSIVLSSKIGYESGFTIADAGNVLGGILTSGASPYTNYVAVTLSPDDTLETVAKSINVASKLTGISAEIVPIGINSYKLAIKSVKSGAINTVRIFDKVSSIPQEVVPGSQTYDVFQQVFNSTKTNGADASFTYNGNKMSSSSNAVRNIAAGLTITLKNVTIGPVRVSVNNKQAFIEAINLVQQFIQEYQATKQQGQYIKPLPEAIFYGDNTLSLIKNSLNSLIVQPYHGVDSKHTRSLRAIGIALKKESESDSLFIKNEEGKPITIVYKALLALGPSADGVTLHEVNHVLSRVWHAIRSSFEVYLGQKTAKKGNPNDSGIIQKAIDRIRGGFASINSEISDMDIKLIQYKEGEKKKIGNMMRSVHKAQLMQDYIKSMRKQEM